MSTTSTPTTEIVQLVRVKPIGRSLRGTPRWRIYVQAVGGFMAGTSLTASQIRLGNTIASSTKQARE